MAEYTEETWTSHIKNGGYESYDDWSDYKPLFI